MTSSSIRNVNGGDGSGRSVDRSSSSYGDVQSNADLYAPPAYTITTTMGEESLDAEAHVPEKPPLLETRRPSHQDNAPSPSHTTVNSTAQGEPGDWADDSAYAIRCSVLKQRFAAWIVKKKGGMALCPLAAAILVREGILSLDQLQLVPSLLDQRSSTTHDPTDPLSAISMITYDLVETGFKAPMTFTYSLTRGWHNAPKLYGEHLREHDDVVDLKTGLVVGGKILGSGIFDGIKDFFVMPVEGARKEGMVGFGKGCGKGVGNLVCNMGEAVCGVVGYPCYGIYKEIKKSTVGKNAPARNEVLTLGEAEAEQAGTEEWRDVIEKWLQLQMRLN